MSETQRLADVEVLARMAARLGGRDPEEHVTMTLAGVTVFEGVIWRYPDFLGRAKAAYDVLKGPTAPSV